MNMQVYRTNRAKLSIDDLRPFDGQWVAFSADGSSIVASADNLARLDQLVVDAGEDPELVGLERIELEDTTLGGAEVL